MPDAVSDPWSDFLHRGLLGAEPLVANASASVASVSVGGSTVPLVTNRRGQADCTWIASLRNAYGPYARAETRLVQISPWLRPFCLAASHAAETLVAAGGLSGGAYLNNWLLSTNLYPVEFTADAILSVLNDLCSASPRQPLVIRSLTPFLHGDLLAGLARAGFLLLPSRQIWLVTDPASGAWRRHRDSRNDLALAESTANEWTWIRGEDFTDHDFTCALQLYCRLYRQRYPEFNPDYTETFLHVGVATGFLKLTGLRPSGGGPLAGFIGMIHRAGVSATPLLGYDLDAPASLGLYRLLSLRTWLTAEKRRTLLHCSAGAGAFKASRGATPHVEFAAVWANHLPLYRRACLRPLAAAMTRWAVPYMETHRL